MICAVSGVMCMPSLCHGGLCLLGMGCVCRLSFCCIMASVFLSISCCAFLVVRGILFC